MLVLLVGIAIFMAIGYFALHPALHDGPPRDLPAEYERLADAYQEHSLLPKLSGVVGRPVPHDKQAACDRAMHAYAEFMLGLDGKGFAAIAMHLDGKMRKYGGDAPFDHICEFLHEEIEAIRKDRRAVDPHRYHFGLYFIPSKHPAMYIPYRPRSLRA